MLGLHTKNGWRAVFAIAVSGTLIGIGSGAAVAAPVTKAEAQAVNGTGGIAELLDTGDCITAEPVAYPGTGPSCGEGLSSDSVSAFSQAVEGAATNPGSLQGTSWAQGITILQGTEWSRGYASVAPIDVDTLDDLNLTDIFQGLEEAQTNTFLDGILNGLGTLTAEQLAAVTEPISDGVDQILSGVQDGMPVKLLTGDVESQCQATGSPLRANAASNVAGVDLVVGEGVIGDNGIVVPMTGPNNADTPPNTQLLVEAPQELANAVLDTLRDSMITSISGELGALAALFTNIGDQIVDPLFDQLEPNLLQPLSDGLADLVQGTVNKQTPDPSEIDGATGTNSTGSVEVIALEIILLAGGGEEAQQTLQLARSACGPNSGGDNGGTPGLQFDKDADTDDGDAKFTLTVHNSTDSAIDDVFVQDFYGDDIDAGDIKDNFTATQGTFDKNTGRWTVGTLGAGQTAKLTFEVDTDSDDLDDGIFNAACVNKETKPDSIQKNDGVGDDTDGCDEDTAKKGDDDDGDDGDGDDDGDDDEPRVVDSGINDGGNLGALAITGLLAASTLVGSAARQRLLLDQ